jgi:hypothetical protein
MITFCAQVEIQGSREQVWERLVEDFPPEYRHAGKLDMNALEAQERAENPDTLTAPASNRNMMRIDTEILEWVEGRVVVVQFSSRPYVRGVVGDVRLKDAGLEKTIATVRIEFRPGCLLAFPARIINSLFRRRIEQMAMQTLAGMRYEIETGKTLEAGQESKLPLDRIQKVRCR